MAFETSCNQCNVANLGFVCWLYFKRALFWASVSPSFRWKKVPAFRDHSSSGSSWKSRLDTPLFHLSSRCT